MYFEQCKRRKLEVFVRIFNHINKDVQWKVVHAGTQNIFMFNSHGTSKWPAANKCGESNWFKQFIWTCRVCVCVCVIDMYTLAHTHKKTTPVSPNWHWLMFYWLRVQIHCDSKVCASATPIRRGCWSN